MIFKTCRVLSICRALSTSQEKFSWQRKTLGECRALVDVEYPTCVERESIVAVKHQCIVSTASQRDNECWVQLYNRCQVSNWWRSPVPKSSNADHPTFCMWFHESTNIRKTGFLGFVKHEDDEQEMKDETKRKETIFLSYIQDSFKAMFLDDLKHIERWFIN